MSMFKAKNKKPFIGDNRVTLDAKHNEMLKYFKQLKNSLPEKRKNLTNFTNQYDELKKIPNKNLTSEQLNLKFSLADSINILKKEIDSIENSDEENQYFLQTGDLLCDYYGNMESTNDKSVKTKIVPAENSIVSFFSNTNNESHKKIDPECENKINKNMSDFVITKENFQRADMLDNYLKIVDPAYIGSITIEKDHTKCSNCDHEKTLIQAEGIMVCEFCGETEFVVIDSDRPSYKDPPPEISYFAYKRRNHYSEFENHLNTLTTICCSNLTTILKNIILTCF